MNLPDAYEVAHQEAVDSFCWVRHVDHSVAVAEISLRVAAPSQVSLLPQPACPDGHGPNSNRQNGAGF